MIGQRTRAALEREKMLALRSIKELEFDRAMGKMSDEDFREMSVRLRARAGSADAAARRRHRIPRQIERDLAKRLGDAGAARRALASRLAQRGRACASCRQPPNDADARFCKNCGQQARERRWTQRGHRGHEGGSAQPLRPLCPLCPRCPLCVAGIQRAVPDARSRSRCPAFPVRLTTCRTASVSVRVIRGELSNNIPN